MIAWRILLLIALDAALAAAIARAAFWLLFIRPASMRPSKAEMRALARYSDQLDAGGGTP